MNSKKNDKLPVVRTEAKPVVVSSTDNSDKDKIKLELIRFVMDSVRFGANIYQMRENTKAGWEDTKRQIIKLDKELERDVKKMEHEMNKIKDETDRLKFIVNSYVTMESSKSALLADAVKTAIIQLTAKG